MKNASFALSSAAACFCFILHLATFFWNVSPVWILPPFALLFVSIICGKAVGQQTALWARSESLRRVSFIPLVYGIALFIYFLLRTGDSTGVSIQDGHYVSLAKGHTPRPISELEYKFFPTLWTRVMSAWMGACAMLGVASQSRPPERAD
jgi:hypothetical protein